MCTHFFQMQKETAKSQEKNRKSLYSDSPASFKLNLQTEEDQIRIWPLIYLSNWNLYSATLKNHHIQTCFQPRISFQQEILGLGRIMCFTPLCTTPWKGGASQCGEGCACGCMDAKSQRTLRRGKQTRYHQDKINHAILLTDYNGDTQYSSRLQILIAFACYLLGRRYMWNYLQLDYAPQCSIQPEKCSNLQKQCSWMTWKLIQLVMPQLPGTNHISLHLSPSLQHLGTISALLERAGKTAFETEVPLLSHRTEVIKRRQCSPMLAMRLCHCCQQGQQDSHLSLSCGQPLMACAVPWIP